MESKRSNCNLLYVLVVVVSPDWNDRPTKVMQLLMQSEHKVHTGEEKTIQQCIVMYITHKSYERRKRGAEPTEQIKFRSNLVRSSEQSELS